MPNIVITGASRGIGAATARRAASAGFNICINYLHSQEEAEALAAELNQVQCHVVQADVSNEAGAVKLIAAAHQALGRIDVLVNNAGYTGPAGRTVATLSNDVLQQVMAVNLAGPILCAREAIRLMGHSSGGAGGHIINVSSTATRMGSPNDWVDYAAAKGAIDVFTEGLAREVAAEGIRVNAVAPGLTDTEIHARAGAPKRMAQYIPLIPMRRAATATEIAECICWLAESAPEYMTGAILPVSGGL